MISSHNVTICKDGLIYVCLLVHSIVCISMLPTKRDYCEGSLALSYQGLLFNKIVNFKVITCYLMIISVQVAPFVIFILVQI